MKNLKFCGGQNANTGEEKLNENRDQLKKYQQCKKNHMDDRITEGYEDFRIFISFQISATFFSGRGRGNRRPLPRSASWSSCRASIRLGRLLRARR